MDMQQLQADLLLRQRVEMQKTVVDGWAVAERFDERYDTEVGGIPSLLTLSLNQGIEMQGGFPDSISTSELANFFKKTRPAQIVDYEDGGRRYTQSEAESLPELASVLGRLRIRIAEYEVIQKAKS